MINVNNSEVNQRVLLHIYTYIYLVISPFQ